MFSARASGKPLLGLGEVGARQYGGDIVNGRTMNTSIPSPEHYVAPTLPDLSPMPLPSHCHSNDASETTARQSVYNAIMDKAEETSAGQHSREDVIALVPHAMPSASQARMRLLHAPDGYTVMLTAKQYDIGIKTAEEKSVKHHSPKTEAAQSQPKDAKTPSRGVEGLYLA
jgi:hypothetical protein